MSHMRPTHVEVYSIVMIELVPHRNSQLESYKETEFYCPLPGVIPERQYNSEDLKMLACLF